MSALAEYSCDVYAMLSTVTSNAVDVQGMAQSLFLAGGGFQAAPLTSMAQQLLCCCSPIGLSQVDVRLVLASSVLHVLRPNTSKDQHS